MDKKNIILGILCLAAVVVIAIFFRPGNNTNNPLPIGDNDGYGPGDGVPVACQMDARVCPDGSVVGRTGPRCEFSACPGATPNPTPTPAPNDNDVTAALNQTVSANGVSITPLVVVSDSRCPANANCIWAGEVELRVRLQKGAVSREVVIKSNASISFENTTVTMTTVLPQKISGTNIPSANYRFTFDVVQD